MGIFDKFFKREKEVLVHLDQELVRKNEQVKALTQELRGRDAQISKLLAEKKEEEIEESNEEREDKIKQKLIDEERKIKQEKFSGHASLKLLFEKKRLLKDMEICDKDDTVSFGNMGDLMIGKLGFVLTDSYGNVLSYGKRIDHVIYKPESLLNQIKRGRILIPFDKDYNPAIDWEELEIAEPKYDEKEKVYRETSHLRKKARDLIIEKDKEIRRLNQYLERIENTNIKLQRELDDKSRNTKYLKQENENYKSELSQSLQSSQQFNLVSGEMQRQITDLTEMKSLYEQKLAVYENTIKDLLEKLEESGDKTAYRKAKEDFKEASDYVAGLKERVREKVTVEEHIHKEIPAENKSEEVLK